MKKETVGRGFRVPGFTTAGIFCGIKTNKQKDLALIFSEEPSVAAKPSGVPHHNLVPRNSKKFEKVPRYRG